MFEKIEDVPEKLRDFYQVDTRSEPTGETQEVEFTYTDENGDTQTATRPEPIFADVDYVVQVSVGEFKSLDDVWRIVKLHAGNRDDLIRQFIAKVCNANQWKFHDKYLGWLDKEPMQDDDVFLVYENINIDDTMIYSQDLFNTAHQAWQAKEPIKPALIDCEQWFLNNAVELRSYAFLPKEKQLEMIFDDKVNGTSTFEDHNLAVKAQYPKAESALA